MGKVRVFAGIGLFALLGAGLGHSLATGYLSFRFYGLSGRSSVDWILLLRGREPVRFHHKDVWTVVKLIFLFSALDAMLAGSFVVHDTVAHSGLCCSAEWYIAHF